MGKRSNFPRRDRDAYPTPAAAVLPLVPWLRGIRRFAEPCSGNGDLAHHLESHGLHCTYAGDIATEQELAQHLEVHGLKRVYQGNIVTGQDPLALDSYGDIDAIISNPPWKRPALHPLITHFQQIAPTWLLLDQDWACTKQAVAYLKSCTDILSIGRVIWIPGTDKHGFDNAAWYRFDARHMAGPVFHPYRSVPGPYTPRRDNGARLSWAGYRGYVYHGPRGTSRSYVLARLARAGRTDLAAQVEAGELSVRAALAALKAAGTARKDPLREAEEVRT